MVAFARSDLRWARRGYIVLQQLVVSLVVVTVAVHRPTARCDIPCTRKLCEAVMVDGRRKRDTLL